MRQLQAQYREKRSSPGHTICVGNLYVYRGLEGTYCSPDGMLPSLQGGAPDALPSSN